MQAALRANHFFILHFSFPPNGRGILIIQHSAFRLRPWHAMLKYEARSGRYKVINQLPGLGTRPGRKLTTFKIQDSTSYIFLRRRAQRPASARRLSVLVVGSGTFKPVMVMMVPTLPVL